MSPRRRHRARLTVEPPFKPVGHALDENGATALGRRAQRVRELEQDESTDLPDEAPPGWAES